MNTTIRMCCEGGGRAEKMPLKNSTSKIDSDHFAQPCALDVEKLLTFTALGDFGAEMWAWKILA